jgi:tetratricopeptide (TPR) repeat protein
MQRVAVSGLAIACGVAVLPMAVAAQPHSAAQLRAGAMELGYNLDYPEALATFREVIAADPLDATSERLAAATLWMHMLFEQGAITVDDYLGQARSKIDRPKPRPHLVEAFRAHLDRATVLAERRLKLVGAPHGSSAEVQRARAELHYAAGAVAALRASYIGTIEGRVLDGVGASRRAYNEHKRALALDPHRADAGLLVGLYRYTVGCLPLGMRLMARLAGFSGNRSAGLQLVEDAARQQSNVQTNAMFMLVLLYNREGRPADALRIIEQLQRRYPRNRLLWLEAGMSQLRAGQPGDALRSLDDGLEKLAQDRRPKAPGEEARWQHYRRIALAALHQ